MNLVDVTVTFQNHSSLILLNIIQDVTFLVKILINIVYYSFRTML
jgi:hypothetical protein